MKINRLLKFTGLISISLIVIISCSKNNQNPPFSHFVSKELIISYQKESISTLISTLSATAPDVNKLKPLVTSDINVYSIVYKTTVDGHQMNASGLVCVPATAGSYPVMSFQNGTNTVNSNAPSLSATNYSYMLIEMVASMGYIVVIADYPGFGVSAGITHPYLIREPTVQSLIDMLYAVKELASSELPGVTSKNEYYLLGYSQGGWATLALHKAMELDYSDDFDLKGSACGAGPYNIYLLLQGMVNQSTYPMPVYLGYILNSYISYKQFTNPVTDILNEPYASKIVSLYNGLLSSDQINKQLTNSIPGLIASDFLTGFAGSAKYESVREALHTNSVTAWHTYKRLLLIHGGNDTQVNPVSTENMYSSMMLEGTSAELCKKVILPGLDHGDGIIPSMVQGILFLMGLK